MLCLQCSLLTALLFFCMGLAGGAHSAWIQSFFNSELKENHHLLAFEMVGHGESGGRYEDLHLGQAVDDLRAVIENYQTQHPEVKKVSLAGGSFGGGVALRALTKLRDIEKVFLRCPLVDFKLICTEVEKIDLAQWEKDGVMYFPGPQVNLSWVMYQDAAAHNLLEELKGCQVPLMICHGTADSIVDIEQSYCLGRVWGNAFELMAVEGGDHMFSNPEDFEEMIRAGVEFLK